MKCQSWTFVRCKKYICITIVIGTPDPNKHGGLHIFKKKNMKPQTQHITPHKYRKFHGYPSTWLANSQDKRKSHHTKQWKHHIQLQTYANTNPVHYPQAQSPHPWGAANASPGHCAAADCWCVGKASWWTLGSSHWNQKVSKGKWRCRGSWLWFYMV